MLDSETKRRIDNCRDILVGKVPDPKSQVEQITIALIYKFMDDMDAQAEELGGKRSFFINGFEKYGWSKLLAPEMGGQDTLNLYSEAITKMTENTHLPVLFRDIFKNAYLPYRDPETLRAFLKEIDTFSYDHSERLGDAFEYLLSVLGSQGDAGQFRTPRHIIDFIVRVINPQKHESILDPACGTAGFLISAWKYILENNKANKAGDKLKPEERAKLAANIHGYDISPDMVRLSRANMYLHGFTDPHIDEYDTLTSEDKWNEHYDVILANPPFMSPKGGIKPHKKFSIAASRSEVLFVDYIHEHLTPTGRAGIIVPEGIIFQGGTAYKALREILVKNSLVAVISLPAGVFQPYSGVKTSILILDKRLAKQTDKVLFVKINNDGFALGAQRRPIQQDDLPMASEVLSDFFNNADELEAANENFAQAVNKDLISQNSDWSLSAERYINVQNNAGKYEHSSLSELCDYVRGVTYSKNDEVSKGGVVVLRANNIDLTSNQLDFKDLKRVSSADSFNKTQQLKAGDILICAASGSQDHVGKVALCKQDTQYYFGGFMAVVRNNDRVLPEYLFECLKTKHFRNHLTKSIVGANINNLKASIIHEFTIPLPPINIQEEIVAEIESYQKIIDGARQVVENYEPRITIKPEWSIVELREIIDELESGVSVNSTSRNMIEDEIGILKTSCVTAGFFDPLEHKAVLKEEEDRVRCPVRKNTIIISRMNTEALVGANAYISEDYPNLFLPDRLWQTVITRGDVDVRYIQIVLSSKPMRRRISELCGGTSGSMKNISKPQLLSLKVPLPSIDIQRLIVAEIEIEKAAIRANYELITRYEAKIKSTIDRVWAS
jgi:type I restriction enzyme M protein